MLEGILTKPPIIVDRSKININNFKQKINSLLRVPFQIRKKLSDNGAYVVIFGNNITDELEMAPYKGIVPDRYNGLEGSTITWDDISGAYSHKWKAILAGEKSEEDILLHELGHCLDYLAGPIYFGVNMSRTPAVAQSRTDKGDMLWEDHVFDWFIKNPEAYPKEKLERYKQWKYFKHADEYFAHCFMLHYQSDYTKNKLEYYAPEMCEFLKVIEERILIDS